VPHIAVGILRLRRSHGRFSVGPPLKSQTLLYDSENDCLLRKNFTTRVWFSRLAETKGFVIVFSAPESCDET
jgi:hypothetical protein